LEDGGDESGETNAALEAGGWSCKAHYDHVGASPDLVIGQLEKGTLARRAKMGQRNGSPICSPVFEKVIGNVPATSWLRTRQR
jgi:hypothetical protein